MLKAIPIQNTDLKGTLRADVLEIWFDKIPAKSHAALIKKIKKPIIYKAETQATKKPLKENIIRASTYIDLDISTPKALIKRIKKINPKIKIIISHHDFKKTPYEKDLISLFKKMKRKNADIMKFATHANGIVDSFRMLDFLTFLGKKEQQAICICMGEYGLLTRITGHLFGNYLMYFTRDKASATAPGQITIKEFLKHTL